MDPIEIAGLVLVGLMMVAIFPGMILIPTICIILLCLIPFYVFEAIIEIIKKMRR